MPRSRRYGTVPHGLCRPRASRLHIDTADLVARFDCTHDPFGFNKHARAPDRNLLKDLAFYDLHSAGIEEINAKEEANTPVVEVRDDVTVEGVVLLDASADHRSTLERRGIQLLRISGGNSPSPEMRNT